MNGVSVPSLLKMDCANPGTVTAWPAALFHDSTTPSYDAAVDTTLRAGTLRGELGDAPVPSCSTPQP